MTATSCCAPRGICWAKRAIPPSSWPGRKTLRQRMERTIALTPAERAALTWFADDRGARRPGAGTGEVGPSQCPGRHHRGQYGRYAWLPGADWAEGSRGGSSSARVRRARRSAGGAHYRRETHRSFVNIGFTAPGTYNCGRAEAARSTNCPLNSAKAWRRGPASSVTCSTTTRPAGPCPSATGRRVRPPGKPDRVELSSVHAIVQYACATAPLRPDGRIWPATRTHPLRSAVEQLRQHAFRQGRAHPVGAVHAALSSSGAANFRGTTSASWTVSASRSWRPSGTIGPLRQGRDRRPIALRQGSASATCCWVRQLALRSAADRQAVERQHASW